MDIIPVNMRIHLFVHARKMDDAPARRVLAELSRVGMKMMRLIVENGPGGLAALNRLQPLSHPEVLSSTDDDDSVARLQQLVAEMVRIRRAEQSEGEFIDAQLRVFKGGVGYKNWATFD
ncbi:hypothetical protein FOA52_012708 [Chlamydomonas sp. UWO 241]|nr:hypothetical protein FOA52_012708 [Chlamydomonas sp. UWO 241]